MRTKKDWSAADLTRMEQVQAQQITGYQFLKRGKPHEHFRTLAGQICSWQIKRFEEYGLVSVNRESPKRYEIALTAAGREVANKYRARPFSPSL